MTGNNNPSRLKTFGAIETIYRAYKFRSRLEAKWAVFFDLCGWSWCYEPSERHGYIPDFLIGQRPVMAEVKPFLRVEEWGEAVQKLIKSGCTEPVVLLGEDPSWIAENITSDADAPVFGWLASPISIDGAEDFEIEPLNFGFTEGNRKLGLCTLLGAWVNQIWIPPNDISHPNKWSRVELEAGDLEKQLHERWATASNYSRWFPEASK